MPAGSSNPTPLSSTSGATVGAIDADESSTEANGCREWLFTGGEGVRLSVRRQGLGAAEEVGEDGLGFGGGVLDDRRFVRRMHLIDGRR